MIAGMDSPPTHRRQPRIPAQRIAAALGVVAALMGAWELLVRVRQIPPYLLPAPSQIIDVFLAAPDYFARATWVTLSEALSGLALGLLVGIGVALAITFWSRLESGVLAVAILVKATPIVAVAPLLIIWLGFGSLPKVILTGLMTFFPVLISVHTGLRRVNPAIRALFHSLAANEWEYLVHARWPSALPYLFAALKATAPLSLVGAVVAEWAGASRGLGRVMWLAYSDLNLPSLFAAVTCSALMGMVLYEAIVRLESFIVFWDRPES